MGLGLLPRLMLRLLLRLSLLNLPFLLGLRLRLRLRLVDRGVMERRASERDLKIGLGLEISE